MKYELEPDNRNCPDETLLDDLRRVASHLKKGCLTQAEYNAHGRFNAATLKNRFSSWNEALAKAALEVLTWKNIPDAELLDDLKRVAVLQGNSGVSQKQYDSLGKFCAGSIVRHFGSWADAIRLAGLERSRNWHPKIADDDLFSNMAMVWESLGRQPRHRDLCKPISRFSADSYTNRFGSWRKALETFVSIANDTTVDTPVLSEERSISIPCQHSSKKSTPRQPSWKLKFLVLRRDRFSCRACGRSPATNPGTQLHLDHIKPWSEGGETTYENLQTLCQVCNIGKNVLTMYEDGAVLT